MELLLKFVARASNQKGTLQEAAETTSSSPQVTLKEFIPITAHNEIHRKDVI